MKKAEIKKLIRMAINKEREFISNVKGDTNPLILSMVKLSEGKIDALDAVEAALNGSAIFLKIMAEAQAVTI